MGGVPSHVNPFSSLHSRAARLRILLTTARVLLTVPLFTPWVRRSFINRCRLPIWTWSMKRPPIYGTTPRKSCASRAMLRLLPSVRYLVAACRNVRRGLIPYTAAWRISSMRRARYLNASARLPVPVLSQMRCPPTCLSTCHMPPLLMRPGVLFCLVDMRFLLSPVARCGLYIRLPTRRVQGGRSRSLGRQLEFQ
jgi:hypothetical protein